MQDLAPKYKFIITLQSETYTIANDIIVVSLREFLKNKLSNLD